MSWAKSLGLLELLFSAAFVIFYALYIFKVINAAKKLNSPYAAVFIKLIPRTLLFALLIVALLGPSFGETPKEIKSIGKDIYFAVDLSASMNAFDIAPTRLEKVKFELKKIAAAFNSDRVGLIIFSSEAFVQCPLTYDKSAFNLFLETLNTNLVPRSGTDFSAPLEVAMKKISKEEKADSKQKSKIIILISDGEDFGENTISLANKIEEKEIKLFTLGIGTKKGSKIRGKYQYKKDRQGNDVVTKLNPKMLKKLAATTGGKYFEISENRNDVSRLINTIANIEGELRDTKKIDAASNKYFYFLGLALILFLLDFLFRHKTLRI